MYASILQKLTAALRVTAAIPGTINYFTNVMKQAAYHDLVLHFVHMTYPFSQLFAAPPFP